MAVAEIAQKKTAVVLGAGVAGLSMGYFLSRSGKFSVTVIDQSPTIGGLCGSFEHNGFVLDYGAHKLYSTIPGNLDKIREVMGDRLLVLPKKNRIYLQGHLIDYPLKMGSLLKAMGLVTFFRLGIGYALVLLRKLINREPPRSYEEYVINCFGKPAYQLVFEPLADKVWGTPSELHPEMARTRVPASGGMEIILKLLGLKKETIDTNAESFFYPKAGFGDFPQKLKEEIESKGGKVILESKITHIEKNGQDVSSISVEKNGVTEKFSCDYLISTIPLPALSRYVFPNNGHLVKHEADNLQFRHLILVYVFIKRPLVLKDQWIFFPERKFLFSRIFEQKQMNPKLGPDNATAVCCDFTCEENSSIWNTSDAELAKKCIEGLVEAGFIKKEDVTDFLVRRQRNFYPRYDLHYPEKIQAMGNQLKQVKNLLLTGRLGMYNYNNSDHCFDMAHFISQQITEGKKPNDIWNALEKRVAEYKIVD